MDVGSENCRILSSLELTSELSSGPSGKDKFRWFTFEEGQQGRHRFIPVLADAVRKIDNKARAAEILPGHNKSVRNTPTHTELCNNDIAALLQQ